MASTFRVTLTWPEARRVDLAPEVFHLLIEALGLSQQAPSVKEGLREKLRSGPFHLHLQWSRFDHIHIYIYIYIYTYIYIYMCVCVCGLHCYNYRAGSVRDWKILSSVFVQCGQSKKAHGVLMCFVHQLSIELAIALGVGGAKSPDSRPTRSQVGVWLKAMAFIHAQVPWQQRWLDWLDSLLQDLVTLM